MDFKSIKERLKAWEETSSRREKILLFVGTIFIPLFLFYKFYYLPAQEKIKNLNDDIKKLELEIAKLEGFVKREKELEGLLKNRKLFLEEVKAILPSEKEIPQLLKDVNLLAKKNGLEILKFTPGGEEKKDYYNIINFSMQFKGSFSEIIKFLNDVERLPRLVTLNTIEFSPEAKEDKILVNSNFKTYKFTGEPLSTPEGKK
jgi:type IV pilus assembly protein PilO